MSAAFNMSARGTALTLLWLTVFLCSLSLVVVVVLGLFFRSRRLWGIAVALMVVDLALAGVTAMLDRLGYTR